MKFLLYCFEWISGLKINYHSEVFVFGASELEQQRVANLLKKCKLGNLPMKYLGMPISDRVLFSNAFIGVVEKMRKTTTAMERQKSHIRGEIDSYQYFFE